MLGRVQQRLVRVLTMQIDELASPLRELARRRQSAIDIATRSPDRRDDPGEHHLASLAVVAVVVVRDEPRLDPCFGRTVSDRLRIGAAPADKFQRVDEQRLARARLAGDRSHRRADRDAQVRDDPEVLNSQLRQHRVTDPEARTSP